ncbi:MAG: glycogen debranching enzyme family protein [Candidatus Altiarchaeota archaeon]|nr:glycogen debranching enzyme family protein [Candidatus Altiarchaeota archaeon]
MGSRKAFPFASFNPNQLSIEKSKGLEWVITNKLGGYSSTTSIGLNTSRFHGLLVSGCRNLKRMLYLQKLDDELSLGKTVIELSVNEYPQGEITEGYRYLNRFDFSYESVSFYYKAKGVYVDKQITPLPDNNSLVVVYSIENNSELDVVLTVKPLLNSRGIWELSEKNMESTPRFFTKNIVGINLNNGYVALRSDNGEFLETPEKSRWNRLFHSKESSEEYCCCPAYLSLKVEPDTTQELTVVVVAYPTENETAQVLKGLLGGHGTRRILSSGRGASIFSLLSVADSFIVDAGLKKTIIAGYPCYGERGRDAMISLPGLTLIKGRHVDAEDILERFLNLATNKGIPSEFSKGEPLYKDIDTSLWLVDRIHQYIKYVGIDESRSFLHTYWWVLKDIMSNLGEREREGILAHEGGTWMKSGRKNAVEAQGLWYNALKIMEHFSGIMDDDAEAYKSTCKRIEKKFMETYWNGRYLKDSIDDDALRPNQVILLSLDYRLVDDTIAGKIMSAVESELLTPFGLRTLSPEDPRYDKGSPYNGGVWPWFFGPYVKAHTRLYGSRLRVKELMEQILVQHLNNAGLGTVSEFLEGEPPFTPRGCISYACSVAELLRCYFEDVLQKKPLNEKKILGC